MSFAGFKKQFNKTSQFLSEKVGGTKGSQLDDDFVELETTLDAVNSVVEDLQVKTKEYLQPNPTARTKLAVQASYQKARGQAKNVRYPQPEFTLAEVFVKGGSDLSDSTPYAASLSRLGMAFNQLSEMKDSLEFSVTQNFLDPLYQLQEKDLKEINHHRKKLESRRLDYDYKKSKASKIPEEELQIAEDKFSESKDLCYNSMMNFIDSDVEQIGQLYAFAEAIRDYHKQCGNVMENLVEDLSSKLTEAQNRPREDRMRISQPVLDTASLNSYDMSISVPTASAPSLPQQQPKTPCCRAIYDFDPENEGELEFKENDIIELKSRIDDNWLEGSCKGKYGYFPENYVEIIVPL